ncbi:hypothetical protein [Dactylosporangium sp. NPDC051484]|uniref:hypothetical protein n=1 Tax=Dactylosporangium sp. NPDC051484 TaxID=3154942 RepID=UPI003450C19B
MSLRRWYLHSAVLATGVTAAALFGTATAATAADPVSVSVQTGTAVLSPIAGGGYSGTLEITVGYTGPTSEYLNLRITNADGIRFTGSPDGSIVQCMFGPTAAVSTCSISGNAFAPGEQRTLHATFTSLAAAKKKTRIGTAGKVEALLNGSSVPGSSSATFGTKLLGTNGHGKADKYKPAVQADLTVTAQPGTSVQQADGSYRTVIPFSVRANTDAQHDYVLVELAEAVPGLQYLAIEPTSQCLSGSPSWWCIVSGGPLPQGATRSGSLVIYSTQAPPSTLTVKGAEVGYLNPTEAKPADNQSTVAITIASS